MGPSTSNAAGVGEPGSPLAGAGESSARPVVLVWLLLVSVVGALLLKAVLSPPPGTAFVGTFYYVDDFYNYLSYVQQAEEGALVFRNKLAPPTLPPALVNLEWLAVGWLSSLLGGAPLLAYRLLGLVALGAYVLVVDAWLGLGGLPPRRRVAGLLLVFTGGGLGGLLMVVGWLPGSRAYDVLAGLFPFVQALANPHFVVGSALLAAGLLAFARGRPWTGVVIGTALGLVRPYDAALLAAVEGLAVLIRSPPARWPRRLLPVAGLLPVLAYNAWVFLWSPGFRIFSAPRYAGSGPSPLDLALAIGPAALAATTVLRLPPGQPECGYRLYLALWAGLAVLMVLTKPVSFSLQFASGIGAPLLVLCAIGLGRMKRGWLEGAVPAFAATAVVVTWLQSAPNRYRNVPADRFGVAAGLGPVCRPGDLVVSPPDIGLYVGGLTSCWPYVSHTAAAEHEARDSATRSFYAGSPDARARLLDRVGATHVVVPSDWPNGGLPFGAPWDLQVGPAGRDGGLSVYSRSAAPPPRRPTP